MASSYTPIYVLLAIYVLAMAIVSAIGYVQNHRRPRTNYEAASSTSVSQIRTHFLAGKNMGYAILLLTTFASVHSGYTIVGVPNEAGKDGLTAFRWVGGIIIIAFSMLIVYPRLRRLSVARNYESPGDFIHDRYRSKRLCALITFCLCVPQCLYLAVQIYSLGAVLSSLTNGELGFYAVIVVSSILILVFEALGGMRSVAYTDAVQATVMMVVFVTVPIIIGVQYGGFVGQVANSEDLPCANSHANATSGCLNYASVAGVDEYFLRSPSTLTIVNYVLFLLSLLSFALNPHMLQRAFTARHDQQIRFVTACMMVAGFLAQTPGVITGVTYLSNQASLSTEYQASSGTTPFAAMLGVFRDQGGFIAVISYIALLAAIAGIMSTADSSLIGVSNCVSCDLFKGWLTPRITPTQTVYIGKAVSAATMLVAIAIAVYIRETQLSYGVLLTLQQGILWQAFPAYVLGLYTSTGTRSILCGVVAGLLCDLVFVSLVFSGHDPLAALNPTLAALDKSWSSFLGVLANLVGVALGHCVCKWRDQGWDDDDDVVGGEVGDELWTPLTQAKRAEIMAGMTEPMTKWRGAPIWGSLCLLFASVFHWIGGTDPDIEDALGAQATKALTYNGYVRRVVAGLTSWSLATLVWYVLAALAGIAATFMWSVDHQHQPVSNRDNNGSTAAAVDHEEEEDERQAIVATQWHDTGVDI